MSESRLTLIIGGLGFLLTGCGGIDRALPNPDLPPNLSDLSIDLSRPDGGPAFDSAKTPQQEQDLALPEPDVAVPPDSAHPPSDLGPKDTGWSCKPYDSSIAGHLQSKRAVYCSNSTFVCDNGQVLPYKKSQYIALCVCAEGSLQVLCYTQSCLNKIQLKETKKGFFELGTCP